MTACKTCRTTNRDIAKFCKHCGSQLSGKVEKTFTDVVGKEKILEELVDMVNLYQMDRQAGIKHTEMDILIMGQSGTGKTYLANVIQNFFFSKGVITNSDFIRVDASEFEGWWSAYCGENDEEHFGSLIFIDNVHLLMKESSGTTAIDSLLNKMELWETLEKQSGEAYPIVIFAGEKEYIDNYFQTNKNSKVRFGHTFVLNDCTVDQLTELCKKALAEKRLSVAPEADLKIKGYFRALVKNRKVDFGNAHESIKKCEEIRLLCYKKGHSRVEEDDVTGQVYEERQLEDCLKMLDELTGLDGVKKEVGSWVANIKQYRQETGDEKGFPPFRDHFIFEGNPGTGKTCVARIFADILDALGVLKTGQLIEVSREDLVSTYIGGTAPKTTQVVESAMGGVLFIDEVYTLADGGSSDFGREAINALLKPLEDRRGEFVCIIAGYSDKMKEFLNVNPGMADRFTKTITFEDYKPKELTQIFLNLAKKEKLELEEDAQEKLPKFFEKIYATRTQNFANGRVVRKYFEEAVKRHRQRLAEKKLPMDNVLTRMDIEGEAAMNEVSVEKIMEQMDREFVGMDSVKKFVNELAIQKADIDRGIEKGFNVKQTMKLNILLTGNPGTGKSTVARKLGEILHAMKLLPSAEVIECSRKDIVGSISNGASENMDKKIDLAMGKILFIDEAYEFVPVDDGGGKDEEANKALGVLMKRMEDDAGKFAVILAGYQADMDRVLRVNEGMSRRITFRINIEDYTHLQLVEIFKRAASKEGLKLTQEAEVKLVDKVGEMLLTKTKDWGNAGEMIKLLEDVKRKKAARIRQTKDDLLTQEVYHTIVPEDIPFDKPKPLDPDEAMAKLDELVGLDGIKEHLRSLIASFKTSEKRAETTGERPQRRAHHYVFAGNPGTGKTTVANLMAEILYSIGVIQRNNVVIATQKDLVAGYVGQTAIKTTNVINSAMGGVLFIDEAYTLTENEGGNGGGFSKEAVSTLVDRLTADAGKFVCILAGYTKPMQVFLAMNPGFERRFMVIPFEDYEPKDLTKIFRNLMHKDNMHLDEYTDKHIEEFFESLYAHRNVESFGNAGAVVNIYKAAQERQGARLSVLVDSNQATDEMLHTLTMEDVTGKKPQMHITEEEAMRGVVGATKAKQKLSLMLKQVAMNRKRAELTHRPFTNLNSCFAFIGLPDTGQMPFLKALAPLLVDKELIPNPAIGTLDLSRSAYSAMGQVALGEEICKMREGIIVIENLITVIRTAIWSQIERELIESIKKSKGDITYVMILSPDEWQMLGSKSRAITDLFSDQFIFDGYTPENLAKLFAKYVGENGMKLSEDAEPMVAGYFSTHLEGGSLEIELLFNKAIEKQNMRLQVAEDFTEEALVCFTKEDIPNE